MSVGYHPPMRESDHPIDLEVAPDAVACGRSAAATAALRLRQALAVHGAARLVVATGASQFELLKALTAAPGIDWSRVTAFHLDEYVGLTPDHPASFRGYLRERFVGALPRPLAAFHELRGDAADPTAECARVGAELAQAPIDLLLCGIGENGHLAFNDPPADFATEQPYLVVALDDACRRQQVGEGWFATLDDVPTHALSMSIQQILAARAIVCTVPDARKAQAVHDALIGDIRPEVPASALRAHDDVILFLDEASAALLPSD